MKVRSGDSAFRRSIGVRVYVYYMSAAVVASTGVFSGCAVAPSADAARVQEGDAQMVVSCKYVGEVQGSSGWGNLAASAGMENAKSEARENAAKLGATHVVWNSITGG